MKIFKISIGGRTEFCPSVEAAIDLCESKGNGRSMHRIQKVEIPLEEVPVEHRAPLRELVLAATRG